MPAHVTLIGLDFGTTTSSAVVATASLSQSGVTGRNELSQLCERYRSEMVFTPLDENDHLDDRELERLLDTWLAAGQVRRQDLFGGGALLTGLTARRRNASAVVQLVRRRLGEALIATADDPRLESWLAFMGSCAGLSRARPGQPVLNLDIGGGTTNLALGIDGQVLRTGSFFVGARHVQVDPGTYRIVRLSPYARALLNHLRIHCDAGDSLTKGEVDAVLDFYVSLLEAAVGESVEALSGAVERLHVQVPIRPPADSAGMVITFSGGVGELIYARVDGKQPRPSTTHFGDLGIDLALRIAASPVFSEHARKHRPATAGRATVYGLLRHSTEVSGSTLFLPRPGALPLTDLPIFGILESASTEDRVREVVELVRCSTRGGCVQIALDPADASAVRAMGEKLRGALRAVAFPPDRPLVLLLRENLGKVLGQYVTDWGALPLNLIVIDELAARDAQYVQIGAPRGDAVPVSFYGLR